MGQTITPAASAPIWWNVVFLPRKAYHWWDAFSPRWARHVLAYAWSVPTQSWLIVDPQDAGTAISALPDEAFDDLLDAWIREGATILRVKRGPIAPSQTRLLQTCSSIVGRVVGAKSAWRPTALFKSLLALEAEIRHVPNEHQGEIASHRPGNESPAGSR